MAVVTCGACGGMWVHKVGCPRNSEQNRDVVPNHEAARKMEVRIASLGNLALNYGSVIEDLESINAKQSVIETLYARKRIWEERQRQMQEQFDAQFRKDSK